MNSKMFAPLVVGILMASAPGYAQYESSGARDVPVGTGMGETIRQCASPATHIKSWETSSITGTRSVPVGRGMGEPETFASLDVNRDGTLSEGEFTAEDRATAKMFTSLDANRNGVLTPEETDFYFDVGTRSC